MIYLSCLVFYYPIYFHESRSYAQAKHTKQVEIDSHKKGNIENDSKILHFILNVVENVVLKVKLIQSSDFLNKKT